MGRVKGFKWHIMVGFCIAIILGLGQPALTAEYKEYKIGMTAPRSGDQTLTGDQQVNGAEAAIKEINDKGGIDGVPLRLIVEDNQAKPTGAVTALTKLINVDKVPVALTTYTTAQLAQAPIADKNKVVMVNVGAAGSDLLNAAQYMFHVQPLAVTLLRVSTNYMCDVLGVKGRWAMLYENESMGNSFNRYVSTLLPKYGVKDIFTDNWEPSASDYRSVIAKALAFKPDAIFVGGFGIHSGQAMRQIRDAGYKGPIMSAWGGGTVQQAAGLGVYNTFYGEQVIPDDSKRIQDLQKYMQGKNIKDFDQQAVNCYDSVYLVADAIKYAKDKYKSNYFTGERVRQAILDKGKYDNLSSPGIMDPKTQILSRQVAVKTWEDKDGKTAIVVTKKLYSAKEFEALPEGSVK